MTRDVKDVIHREIPYLVSVESKEDVMSSEYLVIQNYTKQDFIKKLQQEFPNCELAEEMSKEAIQVLDRSEDGYVNLIQINKQTVTGEQFASCFSLGSTNFCIESYEDRIRIVCRGKGHGIGFSQFGGNQRAKQGDSYDKILEYYYSGTEVKDWIK